MLNNESNDIKTTINNDFILVKSTLKNNTDSLNDVDFINQVTFKLYDNIELKYFSKAVFIETEIVNYYQIQYNFAQYLKTQEVLIHEFSHLICSKYIKEYGHSYIFAIVFYCLLHKLTGLKSNFFRSYDVCEDKNFKEISINCFEFDKMIKEMKWNNFNELVDKARQKYDMMCSLIK